jgi:hypothetical protein
MNLTFEDETGRNRDSNVKFAPLAAPPGPVSRKYPQPRLRIITELQRKPWISFYHKLTVWMDTRRLRLGILVLFFECAIMRRAEEYE